MNQAFSKIWILIILMALLGGVFVWQQWAPSQHTTSYSQKKDYVIQETPEGQFIINKKIGLKFMVPRGWEIKEWAEEGPERKRGSVLF